MEHFYKNVNSEDWFGYEDLYSKIVSKFDDNSHFVEVGVWKGMSACYMAVEIINSGKNIKFDCVDTWEFVDSSTEISVNQFNDLFEIFKTNIEPVKDKIGIVKSLSWDGAKNYEDNTLDFVFIDAGHDYDSVTKDLNAWYPKVKNGGIIAGHDYHYNVGVYPAVNDFFKGTPINQMGACWIVDKNTNNVINVSIKEKSQDDFEINLIWQTNQGDQSTFEYEYTTEILFKGLKSNKIMDYGSLSTVLNNSVIIYSNNQNTISNEFKEYLNKFEEKGYKYYLLHFSNEDLNHDCSYYSNAKHVFRNYYDPKITLNNVTFIPLGFKSGYFNKVNNNLDGDKLYNFAFIGQPKSDRNELIDFLNQSDNNFIHTTNSWNCSTSLSQSETSEIYKKTKFTPCPMGWVHPDSFRIMESLESWSIPILKKYDNYDYFDKVWGESPIPKVENWSELNELNNMSQYNYYTLLTSIITWYSDFKIKLTNKITNIIKNESI